ncbi:ankyrin repeat-containing domain protein [Aspergillus coremiiformis]|uniref:Ankyrin repeat-containing domain protein n=1 Tax=Aspergillus coremiiformis TaxID=138285 RepID=A0A5N6ZH29_9EURO|nr:ankyrin repeat-containing domain protein [Aspergillus coremiiformis]
MATGEPTSQGAAPQSKKHSKSSKQSIQQGLNPLYTPDDFNTNKRSVDVIAVPGLGSDMTFTWVSNNVHWLRDRSMLPDAIPTARISVFGYRSQWYGQDAVEIGLSTISRDLLHMIKTDRWESKTKRPIIFIGHSLGGLVVSKAITLAKRENDSFKGIIECITSCVFLGTPFRGSGSQRVARIIATAGNIMGKAKVNELIKMLEPDSGELLELTDEFLGDIRKMEIDIVCYYELETTHGMMVADKKSATFDGHPRFSWDRAHSQMNKFNGPKDTHYRQVSGTLQRFANKAGTKIKARQDAVIRMIDDTVVEKVLDALDVHNPKMDLQRIRKQIGLKKGMASSWIRESPQYESWKRADSSCNFWVWGSAGEGNTVAAIAIVEDLSKLPSESAVRGHFFCNRWNRDRSNLLSMVKSLAWQLLRTHKHLVRYFSAEDNKSKSGKEEMEYEFDSLPKLWKCFQAALSDASVGTAFWVINGFDQIDSKLRKELLRRITSFQPGTSDYDNSSNGPFVKWLFVSSYRDDIQDFLKEATVLSLEDASQSSKQDDDLRAYVNMKINQLARVKGYSRSLKYFIKSYVSRQAQGGSNYDWVNLVCQELECEELSPLALGSRLQQLPTGIFQLYSQAVCRILKASELEIEISKEILRCLILTRYPPTLEELAIIADLPAEVKQSYKELKRHVSRCGALVTIFKHGQQTKVQLSHFSVRKFLTSNDNCWLSVAAESIQHGVIALRCFDYVLSVYKDTEPWQGRIGQDDPNNSDEQESEDDEAYRERQPDKENQKADVRSVLKYPITEWIEHAVEATVDIMENFDMADVFWAPRSMERASWCKAYAQYNPLNNEESWLDDPFTAMHVAAYFGFMPLADMLFSMQRKEEIWSIDSHGLQPLYWACRRGHLDMVRKLCEADQTGLCINFQYAKGHPIVLHAAVESGKPEIVAYLLNHGAQVNRRNKKIGSALYLASQNGEIDIAKQLLNKQADPNLRGGYYATALTAAVASENLELVELLVQNGSELNPCEEHAGGNPLGYACLWGEYDIVEYLLANGCDCTKTDADGDLPIEVAAREGFVNIVKLLLQYDKSPGARAKALRAAAENGKSDTVNYLVEEFPNLPRRGAFYSAASNGQTGILKMLGTNGIKPKTLEDALYVAVDYQHKDTVQALLEMDIDANAEGEEYGNALQASAYDGTTDIMNLLLGRDADPNRVHLESAYGTALQAACYQGTVENVQILIDRGADVNPIVSGKYGTPLQAACAQGYIEIVQLLLEHGADPKIQGGQYGYAIIAASEGCDDDGLLQLLISNGADVNVRSQDQDTPLTNAAGRLLPKSCLEILIHHGAEIDAKDGDNDTALTNAAGAGNERSVRYLLEQGSNVQHIGLWGGALYRATEIQAIACVKTLLEFRVDVNQRGGDLDTPLQMAAHHGDLELVKLFCYCGADIRAVGGKYHTALQAAVVANSIEIVQWLLDNGADATENGGKYGSVLHAAIYSHDPIPLIDLLLQHDADINAMDARGTPLGLAAAISNVSVLTHLLENGARHDIASGKYGTPLQVACFMVDDLMIDQLIDRGADPFLPGGYYGNAFIAAAANGMVEYLQRWLPAVPADLMVMDALHYAIHFREEAVVRILLPQGADILGRNTIYATAMRALQAGITDTERKQQEGDLDFWYHENTGDMSEDIGDGSEDDESNAEERTAEAAIKVMLQELLAKRQVDQSGYDTEVEGW